MRDLPPSLLEAFRSTLEDSVEADVLLHVVDATDPMVADKITVVNDILDSIGAEQERILIFNKCDMLGDKEEQHKIDLSSLAEEYEYMFVSAYTGD